MTQFHEGQEVEVRYPNNMAHSHISDDEMCKWRKAKIAFFRPHQKASDNWMIEFPDGTRAVFDTKYIRPIRSLYDQRNDGAVFAPSYDQLDNGFYD